MATNIGEIVVSLDPEAIAAMERLSDGIGRLLDRLTAEGFDWEASTTMSIPVPSEILDGAIYGQLVAIRTAILKNNRADGLDLINRLVHTINPAADRNIE